MPGRLSRIGLRLLAFNLLLVFVPVAGLLYLPTYERQLLAAQERSMVQQGRLLSAALSEQGELGPAAARAVLERLQRRTEARLRVVDRDGVLLADSSLLGPRLEPGDEPPATESELRSRLLYRLGAALARLFPGSPREARAEPESEEIYGAGGPLTGREVRAALAGRYGAATRISSGGRRSVTLYSAIPVRDGGEVVGAVLVSQSTARILGSLYDVRLGIFRVFLVSVAVAAVLSLLVATTIAGPLRRLARQARALPDLGGRIRGDFRGASRQDEIGDLARALEDLTRRLEGHVRFIESFATDVAHELKNPLTSIRGATELLHQEESPAERRRFMEIIEREVSRMGALLSEVQEVGRIDAQLEHEERRQVDLDSLAGQVVEGFMLARGGAPRIVYRGPGREALVAASPERLTQVLENLLDNASSLSPADREVEVGLERGEERHRLTVADRGPGIAPEHLERVFTRFFSFRPGQPAAEHAGLGLAIARTVVESYGGSIRAANRPGGGALFEITLPSAPGASV